MAAGQIEVNELRLVHEGCTKFYKVSLVVGPDHQQSVLIKRWGKLAAHGEYRIEKYMSRELGQTAYYETIKGKQKRGYSNDADHETSKINMANTTGARTWLRDETDPSTMAEVMSFLCGEAAPGAEVEIVFEEPAKAKAPDRTGDDNWASW